MTNKKIQFSSTNYILPTEVVQKVVNEIFTNKNMLNLKILDAGCRLGEYKRIFDVMGAQTIGIDFNKECIHYCRKNYPIKHEEYIEGDITNLDMFEDNYFDIVFCIGVAPYLLKKDLVKTLKGFQRILKQEGQIVLMFFKKKSFIVTFITQLISLFPQTIYINFVAPILERLLYPFAKRISRKKVPKEYFKYAVIISLQNLNYGYPQFLENHKIKCPDSGYFSSKNSEMFIIHKKNPKIQER